MRWRRGFPSTLPGAGLPVPTPDGPSPGREPVVALAPPPRLLPFLWGTSRQVVGLFGAGLSCVDLTNPSLTRHSSGTWPRQDTFPPPPDTRLSCRGLLWSTRAPYPPLPGRKTPQDGSEPRGDFRSFRRGTDRYRAHGRARGSLGAQRQDHGARQPNLVPGKLAQARVLDLVDAGVRQIVVVDDKG